MDSSVESKQQNCPKTSVHVQEIEVAENWLIGASTDTYIIVSCTCFFFE